MEQNRRNVAPQNLQNDEKDQKWSKTSVKAESFLLKNAVCFSKKAIHSKTLFTENFQIKPMLLSR